MKTSSNSPIHSRTSRLVALVALPIALVGCGQGPNDAPTEGASSTTHRNAALTVSAAPTPPEQQAARVQLFVQAPFDWSSGDFDLDGIDDINSDPVFNKQVAIPYDTAEQELQEKLDELTKDPLLAGSVDGPAGSHILYTVTLAASARFSQRGQPRLSPWGTATSNGVHVELDNQLEVNLNAHIHIHATSDFIPDPDDIDVPLRGLIGGHGRANLAFFPVIKADGLEAWATLDQSDVDIVGGDGTAIGAGGVIGAGIGIVTGAPIITSALLGAITGEAALELAKDKAKDIILEKAGKAFASSHDTLTALVNKAVQPTVNGANDVLGRLRSMPLPRIGQTLGQLEEQLGMSLDIRSATRNDVFRTAFTARFSNVPAAGVMSGRLRFPKRRCEYGIMDHEFIGSFLSPKEVVETNQQMAGADCNMPEVAQLVHRAFYGQNPDRVLQTGAAENEMTTWASLGNVQMGEMQETGDSYDCPFTVTGLPRAAFMELVVARGSQLAAELSTRHLADGPDAAHDNALHALEKLGGRFVLLDQGGTSMVLTHDARELATLDIGSPAPTATSDCPTITLASGGIQEQYDARDEIPNNEECIACDGEMEWPGADVINENPLMEQPGDPTIRADVGEDPAAPPSASVQAGTTATAGTPAQGAVATGTGAAYQQTSATNAGIIIVGGTPATKVTVPTLRLMQR